MYPTDTHDRVRDLARNFAGGVVRPITETLDRDERFPGELHAEMGGPGLSGVGLPGGMSGSDFDTQAYAPVMEELPRGRASVADQ